MWWLDPRDEATFTIHDQFALGDDLIVAPVVERGATTRDIYLTQGRWRDPFAEVTPCRCSMRCMRRCRSADRSAPFSCLCRQLLHGRGNSSATLFAQWPDAAFLRCGACRCRAGCGGVQASDQTWEGPCWLQSFPAPLNKLPCFVRIQTTNAYPTSVFHDS